ncbi:unnamed protein product [Lasius platythorax]|uniref:Uncharacterized protein n=1 Tax=Lasius platythorax TaxID=488582 RepID=A0AAV2P094_9HYME
MPGFSTDIGYERKCRLVEETDAGVQAYDGSDPGCAAGHRKMHFASRSRNVKCNKCDGASHHSSGLLVTQRRQSPDAMSSRVFSSRLYVRIETSDL